LNIQTSDKNYFTEGIIYANEMTKIVDENHSLQQAFLNELDEKLKGVLQRISGYAVNEDTLRGLIILFSDTNFTRPNYNTYDV
jgi:putative type I restriction enzyme hindVIIP M protein